MTPFKLEEFFDAYEHRPGLINLASSDALPWSLASLRKIRADLGDDPSLTLKYPDVKSRLLPNLLRLCEPPENIGLLPTSGAAEAIALVMHECADRYAATANNCVAIPRPSYGAFHGLAQLLGLSTKMYTYDLADNWEPNPEELLELSKQCRVFVVTNPHNPTGNIVPTALLKQIAAEVAARGGTMIVDEVFSIHGQEESAIGLGEQVMVIGSLSKMYGLPGLRLGWVAAHKERLQRLRTMQQYLTLSLNAMTVGMGAKILETPQLFSRADLLQKNRRILMDWADANKQFVCISHPAGGTTVCLTVKTPMAEEDLFARFLANNVLLVPGNRCFDFGQGVRWFRLGYGTDTDALRRGLERIGDVVATLESKPPRSSP